ncbi:hypothetical protein DAPPUDRAFT_241078 [Daphnia pulex]|uniref:Uncharacterized protein n=1 Tax=Daphnia pulex TaxID=6669 RepID=E9GDC8_DAPPU|nr:hypothetical protein DAPPUDRAFT_241078 [Daphnia pulex]|eukprot:EFX82720.1 hypothetical protein DAPPUDRAFT_241078 [Daphnia pulex]
MEAIRNFTPSGDGRLFAIFLEFGNSLPNFLTSEVGEVLSDGEVLRDLPD